MVPTPKLACLRRESATGKPVNSAATGWTLTWKSAKPVQHWPRLWHTTSKPLRANGLPCAKGVGAQTRRGRSVHRLEKDVFPQIGRFPVTDVTPLLLLEAIRKIEARGVHETAHRARDTCSQVFRFAIATGRAQINPAADLRQALKTAPPVKHMPAVTDPAHLGGVLNSIERYKGSYTVRAALALTPMLLLRSGELRFGRWEEIDLEGALWTIPGERMKGKQTAKAASAPPHLVPLPRQAVEILRELHAYTGPDGLVFKSERDRQRAMSENTVNVALWALGLKGEQTGHGFRATARTLLAEVLSFDDNIIEAQLAHRVRDSLGRAYNRTQFVAQRRQMLQAWSGATSTVSKTAPAARRQRPRPGIGKGNHLQCCVTVLHCGNEMEDRGALPHPAFATWQGCWGRPTALTAAPHPLNVCRCGAASGVRLRPSPRNPHSFALATLACAATSGLLRAGA